nr:MAG TPA: hypothetical protein [Caudoviricetes sp.]
MFRKNFFIFLQNPLTNAPNGCIMRSNRGKDPGKWRIEK